MPNTTLRWGRTGSQTEPPEAKKDAGSKSQKPEAAQYMNWALDRMAAGASLDRMEDCLLYMPLYNSLELQRGVGLVTFSRSTIGTYIDRYGILKTAAIDEPRFEKNGMLIEGVSTNLLLRSEELNDGYYTPTRSSITPNDITAPDGTNTADKLVEDNTASNSHYIQRSIVASTNSELANSISIYAKADERSQIQLVMLDRLDNGNSVSAFFDLAAGTVLSTGNIGTGSGASAEIEELADGWYRCKLSGIPTTTATEIGARCLLAVGGVIAYSGDGTSGLHIWGFNLEELPFASSYIKTVGSTGTRTGDKVDVDFDGNIPHPNDNQTIIFDVSILGKIAAAQRPFHLGGVINVLCQVGTNDWDFFYGDGAGGSPIVTLTDTNRIALRIAGGVASIWANGVKGVEFTPAAPTGAITGIGVGHRFASGDEIYGHISNVRIYNRAPSDQEMSVA